MNIDGLAESAGMDTWHVDNNPDGESTRSYTLISCSVPLNVPSPPHPLLGFTCTPVLRVLLCCLAAVLCIALNALPNADLPLPSMPCPPMLCPAPAVCVPAPSQHILACSTPAIALSRPALPSHAFLSPASALCCSCLACPALSCSALPLHFAALLCPALLSPALPCGALPRPCPAVLHCSHALLHFSALCSFSCGHCPSGPQHSADQPTGHHTLYGIFIKHSPPSP